MRERLSPLRPLRALGSRLEWALLSPATVPDAVVMPLAVLPPVIAGLILFRLAALETAAIALVVGLAATLAARLLRLRLEWTPVVPVLVGVAFLGPAAGPGWVAALAAATALLELIRLRLFPRARLEVGLLAYSAAYLASLRLPAAQAVTSYVRPLSSAAAPEPITLWLRYFPGSASPIDPIRLYVGNVPGPVFATSLLAVAVGLAWLWYTRRLRTALLAGFLLGGLFTCRLFNWNAVFQLDSGPAWFVVGIVLADGLMLRRSRPVQFLMGAVVALGGLGLRSRGLGVEAIVLAAAAVQLAVALTEALVWLGFNRRRVLARFSRWLSRLRRPAEDKAARERERQPERQPERPAAAQAREGRVREPAGKRRNPA